MADVTRYIVDEWWPVEGAERATIPTRRRTREALRGMEPLFPGGAS